MTSMRPIFFNPSTKMSAFCSDSRYKSTRAVSTSCNASKGVLARVPNSRGSLKASAKTRLSAPLTMFNTFLIFVSTFMIVLVVVSLRGEHVALTGARLLGRGDGAETTSNDVDSREKFEDAAFARDFVYLLRQNRAASNNEM